MDRYSAAMPATMSVTGTSATAPPVSDSSEAKRAGRLAIGSERIQPSASAPAIATTVTAAASGRGNQSRTLTSASAAAAARHSCASIAKRAGARTFEKPGSSISQAYGARYQNGVP